MRIKGEEPSTGGNPSDALVTLSGIVKSTSQIFNVCTYCYTVEVLFAFSYIHTIMVQLFNHGDELFNYVQELDRNKKFMKFIKISVIYS